MSVKNLSKPVICPVCQASKKWGEMVKHVAYAGDHAHEQWRQTHGFPATIPFGTLREYEPSLRIAVVREFSQ
jgi:hypothetical protein